MQGGGSVGLQCKGAAVLVYSARGQQCWFTVQGGQCWFTVQGGNFFFQKKIKKLRKPIIFSVLVYSAGVAAKMIYSAGVAAKMIYSAGVLNAKLKLTN